MSYTVVKRNDKYRAIIREKDSDNNWHQHTITLESPGIRAAQKEAREKVSEYESQKNKTIIPPNTLTWLINEYIENTPITPKTKQNYLYVLNKHIAPYFTGKNYLDLTANDFSVYYKEKVEKDKLSPNSVIKHHQILHAAYEYAISGNLAEKNPTERSKKPRKIRKDPDAYDLNDYQRLFIAAKETKIFPEIVLDMVYGLRRSELLGLRWSHINWEKSTIEVSLSVTRVKGEWVFNEAMKTNGSKRTLSMSEPVSQFLFDMYKKQEKNKLTLGDFYNHEFDDFVCVDSTGTLFTPDYITHTFTKLVRKNGLPKLTFHGLRHSFISILLEAGYNEKAVQTASGHENLSTTMNYAKSFRSTQDQMIDYISQFLTNE